MWICLNNAFFSIVQPRAGSTTLVVRARRRGDLERLLPHATVEHTPARDYAFRAHVEREDVANAVMAEVLGIDYGNFKDSVKQPDLKSAYSRVWSVMLGVQRTRPWSDPKPARKAAARAPAQRRLRAPGLDDGESPFFPIPGVSSAAEY